MLGRCPGCDEARLRAYDAGGTLVVRLGIFGFRFGGSTTSADWMGLEVETIAGGADAFDRLWEIVPIVVELLIREGGEMISERIEKVEPPRGRGPNFTDVGERS